MNTDYIKNIETLIKLTQSGKVNWEQQSQTTFTWSRSMVVTTIQLVKGRIDPNTFVYGESKYIFQISKSKKLIIDLNSSQSIRMKMALESLYNTIINKIEKEKLDFFDDLIDGI